MSHLPFKPWTLIIGPILIALATAIRRNRQFPPGMLRTIPSKGIDRNPTVRYGLRPALAFGQTAAEDRRCIREGVKELQWIAALKPTTVGIAAYCDAEREYVEIAVLELELRSAACGGRLVELVHRAVPYPVLLIACLDGTPELSLAHKRRSLGEAAAAFDREAALREYCCLNERIVTIRSVAAKEKQMARGAEMNMELARLRKGRDAARGRL